MALPPSPCSCMSASGPASPHDDAPGSLQETAPGATSLDSHEGLSTKIELTCAASIRRQDAGSCWRAKESAGTLCRNLQRAGEDYGRVFETLQSLPSRSDRLWRSRRRNPERCGLTF